MADPGFQVCVDAGGQVRKKSMGIGKHKLICFHHGKAYHSDVIDGNVQKNQNQSNRQLNDKKQQDKMDNAHRAVMDHNQ